MATAWEIPWVSTNRGPGTGGARVRSPPSRAPGRESGYVIVARRAAGDMIGCWLRVWSYAAASDAGSKRDLRLDLLRGFAVFAMVADHVGGDSSWLYAVTGGDRFFVSAAEVFVVLSGLTMGMVYTGVFARGGTRAVLAKAVRRAHLLYVLTVS